MFQEEESARVSVRAGSGSGDGRVCVCEAGASLMRPCLHCLARGDAKRMKAADFCVRAGAALLRVAAAAAAAA